MFNVRETQCSNVMYVAEDTQSSGNIRDIAPGEYLRIADDNDAVLHTSGLSDCSALIVMSGWNGTHYEKRSLAHLWGGSLSDGLNNKDCYSLLENLREDLKDGGELILVNGDNAQSNLGMSITLGQQHAGQYPLLELMSDEKINSKIVGSNFVTVHPDGNISYNDDSYCRGIIPDKMKHTIVKDACEERNWQPVSHHRQKDSVCAQINEGLQKDSDRSFAGAASNNIELQERPAAEAAHGEIVRVSMPCKSDSASAQEALLNDYRLRIVQNSPLMALEAVTALVTAAVADPSAAASVIRAENVRNNQSVSRLPELIAKGGIDPLAGSWIDLLHLLYKENHLSGEEVVQALLPHCVHDKSHSVAHALAGAAWSSEAATKLCALLSEVAGNDRVLGQEIVKRLSLEQPGYGFRQLQLDLPADFYKRVKRADNFRQNEAAKAQLKQNHLIPENRELFRMARGIQAGKVSLASSLEVLENKIKVEITPRVKESLAVMEGEKASLDRAKISAKAKLDEINIREREASRVRKQQAAEAQARYAEAQNAQYEKSREQKMAAYEQLSLERKLRQQENISHWKRAAVVATESWAAAAPKQSGASSASVAAQQPPVTGEHPQDKNIQERLNELRSFRTDYELEQRWNALHSFVGDLDTEHLQERLNRLRGSDESRQTRSKTLAPPLERD